MGSIRINLFKCVMGFSIRWWEFTYRHKKINVFYENVNETQGYNYVYVWPTGRLS